MLTVTVGAVGVVESVDGHRRSVVVHVVDGHGDRRLGRARFRSVVDGDDDEVADGRRLVVDHADHVQLPGDVVDGERRPLDGPRARREPVADAAVLSEVRVARRQAEDDAEQRRVFGDARLEVRTALELRRVVVGVEY